MKVNNITLNFLDKYYQFYEWLDNDDIKVYDEIMLYKVDSNVIEDFISNKIEIINNENDICIFSDSYSYIAIKFDSSGKSIFKSSLTLHDEIKLNNIIDDLKKEKLIYKILVKEKDNSDLRINSEIRKIIEVELNRINNENNIEKLEYLYYEWFNKNIHDKKKMLNVMYKKIKKPLTDKEIYIYKIIKKSYKLV